MDRNVESKSTIPFDLDLNYQSEERSVIDFMTKILVEKRNTKRFEIDLDNFAFLLCALLKFVQLNLDLMSIQFSENNTKGLIILNKGLGFKNLQLFSKLFEELTLNRLHFLNTEKEWIAHLAF